MLPEDFRFLKINPEEQLFCSHPIMGQNLKEVKQSGTEWIQKADMGEPL